MQKCPGCNATLPDMAAQCQFCGATIAPTGPPSRQPTGRAYTRPGKPPPSQGYGRGEYAWAWKAYYAIAVWWILSGGWQFVRPIVLPGEKSGSITFSSIIGLITAAVGIGLLLKVDFVRGVVNVISFLQILDGAFGLIIGLFLTGIFGWAGAFGMILSALQIALGAFMIFLIGETETHAPNF